MLISYCSKLLETSACCIDFLAAIAALILIAAIMFCGSLRFCVGPRTTSPGKVVRDQNTFDIRRFTSRQYAPWAGSATHYTGFLRLILKVKA